MMTWMMKSRLCVSLLVSTGLIGCGPSEPEWTGTVTELDGVPLVRNPTVPLLAPGEVTTERLWATEGPSGEDYWEAPNRLSVGDAEVYLVDRVASKVHRVTKNGELLPAFGEPGEGPGQYRRIVDAIPLAEGLAVVDAGNGRMEILDSGGAIKRSIPLDQWVFGAIPAGEHAVALYGALGGEDGWIRVSAFGESADFVVPELEFPEGYDGPASTLDTWGERPTRLRRVWPEVRVFSPSGDLERIIEIPFPPAVTTDQEMDSLVAEVRSLLARDGLPSGVIQQQVERMRSLHREKGRFRTIQFDDASGLAALWQQDPEDIGGSAATLHLLTLEGVYLASLDYDTAWSDFALADGVLYVLCRDPETDLVALSADRVIVPPGALERASSLVAGQNGNP